MTFPSQSRSLAFASLLSLSLLSAYAVRAQEKTPDPKPTQPTGDTPKPSETPTSDKVLLRQIYRKGDVSETDQVFTMSMEMQATVGGNSIPAGSVTGTSHEKYREEVLGYGPGASIVRRRYSVARQSNSNPKGKKKTIRSFQGKMVTFRKTKGRMTLEMKPGTLTPKDRKELLSSFGNAELAPFPDHPVGPGDEWDVKPAVARAMFGVSGLKDIRMHVRFESIAEFGGQHCAQLQMHVTMKGTDDGIRMSTEVDGPCYHAVDLGRILSMDLSGTFSASGKFHKDGQTVDITGQGEARLHAVEKVTKSAGKPVQSEKATEAQ